MTMGNRDEIISNLVLELRRGTIVLCVLSQLSGPQYGYSLVQSMEAMGLELDAGTLYPLLRRLEKQELLISKWETEGSKPRKYYCLSDTGREVYGLLCSEWNKMNESISKMICR